MKTKDLKSGTKLPLMNLKGKDYLQVAHRLVWFREEHPHGKIQTEIIAQGETTVCVKATISVPDMESNMWLELASGHKTESKSRFPDFVEKAETGAVGRALAMAGYGTQFEPEFDEEDRIVDSPIGKNKVEDATPAPQPQAAGAKTTPRPAPPSTSTRDTLNTLIRAKSQVVISKRLFPDADALRAVLKKDFGTEDFTKLPDDAAQKFHTYLDQLATKGAHQ